MSINTRAYITSMVQCQDSFSRGLGTISLQAIAFLLALVAILSTARAQDLTVLHTFTGGVDGGSPVAGLVRDSEGNLYGTAGDVVFKLDNTGKETVVFKGLGSMGALVQDARGNLYGTSLAGGASNLGIVFEVDTSGKATVLHSFVGGADGDTPVLA